MSKELFNVQPGDTLTLGVTKVVRGVQFAVYLPNKKKCMLKLYRIGRKLPAAVIPLKDEYKKGSVYFVTVTGIKGDDTCNIAKVLTEEYEYMYEADGEEFADPYAQIIHGRDRWGKRRNPDRVRAGISLEEFDWKQDVLPRRDFSEVIMYQLHVRGFTKHSSSKVKDKGTYLGIIEKIPYLKELGINALMLLPCYEFDELSLDVGSYNAPSENDSDEDVKHRINYWGYGTKNTYYLSPKSSYASDVRHSDVEFKEFVRQMHLAGIEVLMDIYFKPGTNLYLMTDCLRHWVINYHIDGFRVNQEVMPAISLVSDPIISGVKLLTSYWDENMLHDTGALNDNVLAEYNEGFMNDARRFLKSDEGMVQTFSERFKRNAPDYSIINFITHVNGFTMMDLVSYDIKHNESNGENNNDGTEFNYSWNCGIEGKTRKRAVMRSRMNQICNAFTMLLCSQGTPMLLAGDEFGNTQLGNNNAYCHDDNITWLNWKHTKSEQDIFEFVKRMIAFRKQHCVLHGKEPLSMFDTKGIGIPDMSVHGTQAWRADFSNYSRMLGILLGGRYGITEDDDIYIAFNMFWEQKVFELPNPTVGKKWYPAIDTHSGEFFTVPPKKKRKRKIKSEKQLFREYMVEPRSIVVFVGR